MRSTVFFVCVFFVLGASAQIAPVPKKELKLIHVLSGNKFYVPGYNDSSPTFEVPKNLTYSYFLKNAVEIPNSIKMHLFNLGEYLRQTYGNLLGSLYSDEAILTQTMAFPVSIMAGELINAGLWPPVGPQIWKDDLPWQPVPFVYTPADADALLLGTLCPTFAYETEKALKNLNLTFSHTAVLNHIKQQGNVSVTNPIDVSLLYLAIENSLELNQTQPEWIKQVYPSEELLNVTITAYELLSKTTTQRRLNGGSFLKRIINDSKNYIKGTVGKDRKINLYSGDDRNLAGVFNNLNIPFYDIPKAGAALIFELYEEAGKHFIKVIYYLGEEETPERALPYVLEGCELFCPFEKFQELVSDSLPMDELSLCGSMVTESKTNDASVNVIPNYITTVLTAFVLFVSTRVL